VTWALPGLCCTLTSAADAIGASAIAAEAAMASGAKWLSFICFPPISVTSLGTVAGYTCLGLLGPSLRQICRTFRARATPLPTCQDENRRQRVRPRIGRPQAPEITASAGGDFQLGWNDDNLNGGTVLVTTTTEGATRQTTPGKASKSRTRT